MATLDGVEGGAVAAAATKQIARGAVFAVWAAGIEDEVVVATGRVLAQETQAQRHVVAEIHAVAASVAGSHRVRADAVAATEGEVGGALQAGCEVVAAGAQAQLPLIVQFDGNFAKEGQFLFAPREVVEEGYRWAARAHRIHAGRRQRDVAKHEAIAGVVVVEVVDVFAVGAVDGGVHVVADVGCFRFIDVQPGQQSPASIGGGGEAELVGLARVGGVVRELLGGVVAVVGIRGIGNVAVAEVIRHVAAAGVVVGVVHHAVHVALEVPAGVHHVQVGEAALQRPGG